MTLRILHGVDEEWDKMYKEYIARVPSPVSRDDPPPKTRMEDQFKQEEFDFDADPDDTV